MYVNESISNILSKNSTAKVACGSTNLFLELSSVLIFFFLGIPYGNSLEAVASGIFARAWRYALTNCPVQSYNTQCVGYRKLHRRTNTEKAVMS